MSGPAVFEQGIHLIRIEDHNARFSYRFTEREMREYFNSKQREMLANGYVIICNRFHGNWWVKGANATACDMIKATNDRMGA